MNKMCETSFHHYHIYIIDHYDEIHKDLVEHLLQHYLIIHWRIEGGGGASLI